MHLRRAFAFTVYITYLQRIYERGCIIAIVSRVQEINRLPMRNENLHYRNNVKKETIDSVNQKLRDTGYKIL